MSPMSDQPLTVGALATALAQSHREIVLPDIERVVRESEFRLRNEMQTFHDEILHRLSKLESEYHLLTAGLARVEGRLDRVEVRLDRMDQRLGALEAQYRDLLGAVNRLEERLSRVEAQVDAAVAAQEKGPLRAEVADLRTRVDSLQAQVRSLEKRFDQ